MSRTPVGVVGLGYLGTALGERLLKAGFPVRCWNRTREKAGPLIDCGAEWADNPFEVCDRVVVCLFTSPVVEQTLASMQDALGEGQCVLDATTGGPEDAPRIGQWLAKRGVAYLEMPIAASSEQTRQGDATAFVGGSTACLDEVRPIVDSLVATAHYVGPWGAAAKFKLVNNVILGLNRAALAEGLAFAAALGLDPAVALSILKQCNAYSGVMDTKGQKMVEGDYTPQARLAQHAKDVRIIHVRGESARTRAAVVNDPSAIARTRGRIGSRRSWTTARFIKSSCIPQRLQTES